MSMADWARAKTEIAHLKIRYPAEVGDKGETDASLLRLRVERALGRVDLQPAGLREGQVFIVRKLTGVAPLSLASAAHTSQQAWQESVRSQMESLYTSAARPATGSISSDAASVLFADAGEMLACLTHDLLGGSAWERWYWQPILRSIPRSTGTALALLWSKQPEFVPAVLGSLRLDEAVTALATFTSSEVNALTRALHQSFDLPSEALVALENIDTRRNVFTNKTERQTWRAQPQDRVHRVETQNERHLELPQHFDRSSEAGIFLPVVPPWQRWLSRSSIPALSPQAHYLLGLGLSLHHAPSVARSANFAKSAVSWLSAQAQPSPAINLVTYVPPPAAPLPSLPTAPRNTTRADIVDVPETSQGFTETFHTKSASPSIDPTVARDAEVQDSSTLPDEALEPETLPLIPKQDESRQAGKPAHRPFIFGVSQALPTDGAPTELGGVLYLVHLLSWLNLPASWDADGSFSAHLSGWAIIEAMARGLLGTLSDRYAADPMWSLLAALDKREPAIPPGAELAQQFAFRLPASWLLSVSSSQPSWLAMESDDRLCLFDDRAGYLVVDIPLSGRAVEEAILAEIEVYLSQGINARWRFSEGEGEVALAGRNDSDFSFAVSEPLAWWLARVLGFLRAYLLGRLGENSLDAEQLAALLLNRPGQLLASRTHIDLHMSLEAVSLPIRRAGLDLDPGWMPDLGRVVLFHYD